MLVFLAIFLVPPKMGSYHLVRLRLTSDSGVARRTLKSLRIKQKHILILLKIIAMKIQMIQLVLRLHFLHHKME